MAINEQTKIEIRALRLQGYGYRKIAAEIGISRDLVRNYCKTNGLDGLGSSLINVPRCANCGKAIEVKPIGRRRKYCSDKCRHQWQEANPLMHEHSCIYCGKKFTSPAKLAKYCCHKCFERDRFWRKEDVQMVMEYIEKAEPVPNAPGWIKKLINGILDE